MPCNQSRRTTVRQIGRRSVSSAGCCNLLLVILLGSQILALRISLTSLLDKTGVVCVASRRNSMRSRFQLNLR